MSEWKPMSEGSAPPPKTPTSSTPDRKGLVIGLSIAGFFVLMCCSLMGYGVWVGMNAPEAMPEDRAGVVNVYDVYGWLEQGTAPDAQYEEMDVGPMIFGSREWDYEYEPPESDDQLTFVSSSRSDEMTESEAGSTFRTLKFAAGIGVGIGGDNVEVVDVSDQLTWGDDNYLAQMVGESGPFGHILVTRRGKTVLFAVFGVVYFEDADAIDEFLVPVLERAASYEVAERAPAEP